jgi:hypothetical protein
VDVGCDRSGGADTGAAIAAALGLSYAFVCEFEELRSPLRGARAQGGGVHGNAILSRFDISNARALPHSHHPVDWDAGGGGHALAAREPRRGRRAALAATVAAPGGPLLVYSVHLEVRACFLLLFSCACAACWIAVPSLSPAETQPPLSSWRNPNPSATAPRPRRRSSAASWAASDSFRMCLRTTARRRPPPPPPPPPASRVPSWPPRS